MIAGLGAVIGGALIGTVSGLLGTLWVSSMLLREADSVDHLDAVGYGIAALALAIGVAIVTGLIGAIIGYVYSDPREASRNNAEKSGSEDLVTRYQTRLDRRSR